MAYTLPPLKALHAFESAARHLSFTRAAQELHVTQAAVSQQVKQLENRLGIQLFRRLNRALRLTEAGQMYLPEVQAVFDKLSVATRRLREGEGSGVLTVSVLGSFAAKWLVPRLWRFRERHPDLDVRLSAVDELVDLLRDDVDVAIRYGGGRWSGLCARLLMTEDIFPVCSPRLLTGPRALKTSADLRHHTLLHEENSRTDWRMWLLAAGVSGVDPVRGPSFSHASLVLQAAADGQGVALGRGSLAGDDIAQRRLVRPFDFSVPAEYAYYIVCPEGQGERPKVAAFRDWLLEQAETDPPSGALP